MESIDLFKLPPKVFISYSHADREFAEKLAHDLVQSRINVWWDEWEIKVGDSLIQKIERGITSTSYLVIVLSTASVESAWVQEELRAALTRQLSERKTIALPVLLNDCDIPLFLRDKKYADFRKDYDFGLKNLSSTISSPDIGSRGRDEVKEYFNDYAIDWFTKDKSFIVKVNINSHSPKLKYSVNAEISAVTNEKLYARYGEYAQAGFSWAIPSAFLSHIKDMFSKTPPIVLIEGDKVAQTSIETLDPKSGIGSGISVEARRMGEDPGDDILYEWGSILTFILESHDKKVLAAVGYEAIESCKKWIRDNPPKTD
jgi:hypothetical protein